MVTFTFWLMPVCNKVGMYTDTVAIVVLNKHVSMLLINTHCVVFEESVQRITMFDKNICTFIKFTTFSVLNIRLFCQALP